MLVVISPAKKLRWDDTPSEVIQPRMQDQANLLASCARELTTDDLKRLMKLSDALARLNRDRFAAMEDASTPENSRPAAATFAGDTYQGLEWATMDEDGRRYADSHLRILSGLYGVLRPRDTIQPYRLEMGIRLETGRGRSLYEFWGDRIARALAADAAAAGTGTLLNCASQEYFGAVDLKALGLRVVTPRFLDEKNGEPKVIPFHAKRARGAMARFICTHHITDPGDILTFDAGGYVYAPDLSEPDCPAFYRGQAAAQAA